METKKVYTIAEVILSSLLLTGRSFCTGKMALTMIDRIKDKYPHIERISRTGRGEKWPKDIIGFGRKFTDNVINTDGGKQVFGVIINKVTMDISICVLPNNLPDILARFNNRTISRIPQFAHIYDIPDDVKIISRAIITGTDIKITSPI